MRKVLSDATIRALQPPPKGYTILWDASLRGFGCRISQAGTRAFVVLIASGRPYTIGRYPFLSLSAARGEAKRLLAEKTLGHVRPTHTAFEDARKTYLAECDKRVRAGTMKPTTVKNYKLLLNNYLPFGRQSISEITLRQTQRGIDHLTPSMQEHCLRCYRTFFRWAVRHNLLERSPMANLPPIALGRPRTRVLTDDELRAVWNACRSLATPFHAILSLLVLTGLRRGELSKLEWSWCNFEESNSNFSGNFISLPPKATKNGRELLLPIGPEATAILASLPRLSDTYVFPASRQHSEHTTTINGWSKPKTRFDHECGVTGWTLHDLRRTFATNLQRLGVRLEVTEALLNHVSGSRSGIVAVYQQHQWADEKREAIRQWEAYLANLSKSHPT